MEVRTGCRCRGEGRSCVGGGSRFVVLEENNERHHRQKQLRAPTAQTGREEETISESKTRHFSSFDEKVKTCFSFVEKSAQWFLYFGS